MTSWATVIFSSWTLFHEVLEYVIMQCAGPIEWGAGTELKKSAYACMLTVLLAKPKQKVFAIVSCLKLRSKLWYLSANIIFDYVEKFKHLYTTVT
jgi:hypothetical protein